MVLRGEGEGAQEKKRVCCSLSLSLLLDPSLSVTPSLLPCKKLKKELHTQLISRAKVIHRHRILGFGERAQVRDQPLVAQRGGGLQGGILPGCLMCGSSQGFTVSLQYPAYQPLFFPTNTSLLLS